MTPRCLNSFCSSASLCEKYQGENWWHSDFLMTPPRLAAASPVGLLASAQAEQPWSCSDTQDATTALDTRGEKSPLNVYHTAVRGN